MNQVILRTMLSRAIDKTAIDKVKLDLTKQHLDIIMAFLTELSFLNIPEKVPLDLIVLLELYDKLLTDYLRQTNGVKLKLRASEGLALKRLLLGQLITDDLIYLEVQYLIAALDAQLKLH